MEPGIEQLQGGWRRGNSFVANGREKTKPSKGREEDARVINGLGQCDPS